MPDVRLTFITVAAGLLLESGGHAASRPVEVASAAQDTGHSDRLLRAGAQSSRPDHLAPGRDGPVGLAAAWSSLQLSTVAEPFRLDPGAPIARAGSRAHRPRGPPAP